MRGVTESATIRRPFRQVWDEASDPARWPGLADGWGGGAFSCRIDTPDGRPAMGSEIAIVGTDGREKARARLTRWDPPRSLTVTLQHDGWLSAYHGSITVRISEIDDDMTSVEIALNFIMMNRLVEILSLLLPVGPLYRRGVRRLLAGLGAPRR